MPKSTSKAKAKATPKHTTPDAASAIIPSALYLGPRSSASSTASLTSNSITTVLSIGISPSRKLDGITYHRLSLNDSPSSSITTTLNAAVEIINAALRSKKGQERVLIHCAAGVSRSPTIVAGYLMKEHGMSLRAALGHVLRARPQVSPNSGFLQQLKELEIELMGATTLDDIEELPRREADKLALFMDGEVDHVEGSQGPGSTVTAVATCSTPAAGGTQEETSS